MIPERKVKMTRYLEFDTSNKLKVYLDLGKLEEKKENLENNFLFTVWFEKSQKEKIKRKMQGKFELL